MFHKSRSGSSPKLAITTSSQLSSTTRCQRPKARNVAQITLRLSRGHQDQLRQPWSSWGGHGVSSCHLSCYEYPKAGLPLTAHHLPAFAASALVSATSGPRLSTGHRMRGGSRALPLSSSAPMATIWGCNFSTRALYLSLADRRRGIPCRVGQLRCWISGIS